jgi:hypothetical protein
LLAALLFAPAAAQAAARPTVLELFTSESCSSCPPADNLLAELARTRPDLLPLAFHVDYWNALSWKDRFSSPAATARQRHYAAALGSDVYTPQLVVDGHVQAVGSDRAAVKSAIAQAQATQAAGPDISVSAAGGQVAVSVGAAPGRGDVLLVGFDNLHTTDVGSGENAGTAVTEANVVRSLAHLGAWSGAEMRFNLPRPAGQNFAVLVQGADGTILGAQKD